VGVEQGRAHHIPGQSFPRHLDVFIGNRHVSHVLKRFVFDPAF
jgi:hypothetical protein